MSSFRVEERTTVPLVSLPGYMEWSERRLGAGESPALMATLDAQTISVDPEGAADLDESYFDGLLEVLKEQGGQS